MRRILIMALAGIGDTILATPMMSAVRARYPDAKIDALVMWPGSADVLGSLGFLDDVYRHDFWRSSYGRSLRLVWRLRRNRYDCTIVAFPANRAHYNALAFLIGSRWRLGHDYKNGSHLGYLRGLLTHRVHQSGKHCMEENMQLAKLVDASGAFRPCSAGGLGKGVATPVDNWLTRHSSVVVFHPGCSTYKNHERRRWPVERYLQLAESLTSRKRVGVLVVLGSEERHLEKAFGVSSACRVFASSSLKETASVLRRASLLVASDSGMVHLATALNLPSVVLFGPTNEHYVAPLGVAHEVVRRQLPCAPCFEYGKKPLHCGTGREFACMDIPVDQVLSACMSVLQAAEATATREEEIPALVSV